jgi:hypothetical protein
MGSEHAGMQVHTDPGAPTIEGRGSRPEAGRSRAPARNHEPRTVDYGGVMHRPPRRGASPSASACISVGMG